MKKILKIWYVFVIITLLIVVGILIVILNKKNTTETKETSNIEIKVKKKELTAENIVEEMKKKNENIGRILVFNEETDFNSLLGRPGQYASKATFEDVRIEQTNKELDPEFFSELEREEPIGGTLEVFNNEKDMKKRKDYIDSFTSSMSMIAEYSYGKDRFLLRLDKGITPSQAEEYEKIFYEIIDNGIIEVEESKEDEEELQGIIENFETTLES